ncbi:hypothetical protein F511_13552 [Dorcoceras hygrometricum]|uniref:Uncharacterized protein n=1 Tax=Dorcoceras hygrometricum TaxID=472368 RepID=A0A2Z7C3T6_9LAMI|nr:hypothetical protein F511_13552 [Dorcoceras hygrometricum]
MRYRIESVAACFLIKHSVQISPTFNVSDHTSPVCCAISDQCVVLQISPAFGFDFRHLLRVLCDVVLEFCRCLALSVIPHLAKFSPIPFSVSRTPEHCSAVSSPANSCRFRPPFFTFEVALDSSREDISIDISFGDFNQLSRALLVIIIAQNQDLSGYSDVLLAFLRTGAYCVAGSCVLVFPLDSSPGLGELQATGRRLRVSRGNRHFTVDCGRQRQSGPRSETGFLRQPALEGLTRSARTDSPRQDWPEQFPAACGGGGGGAQGWRRRILEEGRGRRPLARDTASRGPTTIVAPESQFRTCPTDHGKSV